MNQPADRALLAAIAALNAALEEFGAPAMIIGGIAVIARGVARQTVDVDVALWGEGISIDHLLTVLAAHGIRPRIPDARQFADERQVLLLQHEPTGSPIEIALAWLPFEREAIARATSVDFGGIALPVALPDDLIAYKAVAWRERDRSDIERLLVLHGKSLDLERVRALVRQFAAALDEPERSRQFDEIVARALGRST